MLIFYANNALKIFKSIQTKCPVEIADMLNGSIGEFFVVPSGFPFVDSQKPRGFLQSSWYPDHLRETLKMMAS